MSAHLLAEFDSFYRQTDSSEESRNSLQNGSGQQNKAPHIAEWSSEALSWNDPNPWQQDSPEERIGTDQSVSLDIAGDDDWGDFESGQKPESSVAQQEHVDSDFSTKRTDGERNDKQGVAISSETNYKSGDSTSLHNYIAKERKRPPRDENILFDAEDESDGDDFGDFEIAEESETTTVTLGKRTDVSGGRGLETLIDFGGDTNEQLEAAQTYKSYQSSGVSNVPEDAFGLISETSPGSKDLESTLKYPEVHDIRTEQIQTEGSQVVDEWEFNNDGGPDDSCDPQIEHHSNLSTVESIVDNEHQIDKQYNATEIESNKLPTVDDPWDDFEECAVHDKEGVTKFKSTEPVSAQGSGEFKTEPQADERRPTVPMLLQAEDGQALAAPPTNVPPPALLLPLFPPIFAQVQTILYEPAAKQNDSSTTSLNPESNKEFLDSFLGISTVLAYIIGGRKLRWKRDTILSQSMRIGPAASGKSGGMKLAGIDKSESVREDKEVADVVRLWRGQAGRLRSAIYSAGITTAVPDITETLAVRLTQQSEGAISAARPCALCALKRNERIPKVDTDVQDSFGEFWTENWGHTLCKSFWYSYERRLAAR